MLPDTDTSLRCAEREERSFVAALLWMTAKCRGAKAFEAGASSRLRDDTASAWRSARYARSG